jgi:hypothetical protein
MQSPRILSKSDLRDQGWSESLIYQTLKNVGFKSYKIKLYRKSDVIVAIQRQLQGNNSPQKRKTLVKTLNWLEPPKEEEPDEFIGMSLKEKAEILKARIKDNDIKFGKIMQEHLEEYDRIKQVLKSSNFEI